MPPIYIVKGKLMPPIYISIYIYRWNSEKLKLEFQIRVPILRHVF